MKIFAGSINALPEPRPGWEGGIAVSEDVLIETATGLIQIAAAGVSYHPEYVAALQAEQKAGKTPPKNKGGETPPENKGNK